MTNDLTPKFYSMCKEISEQHCSSSSHSLRLKQKYQRYHTVLLNHQQSNSCRRKNSQLRREGSLNTSASIQQDLIQILLNINAQLRKLNNNIVAFRKDIPKRYGSIFCNSIKEFKQFKQNSEQSFQAINNLFQIANSLFSSNQKSYNEHSKQFYQNTLQEVQKRSKSSIQFYSSTHKIFKHVYNTNQKTRNHFVKHTPRSKKNSQTTSDTPETEQIRSFLSSSNSIDREAAPILIGDQVITRVNYSKSDKARLHEIQDIQHKISDLNHMITDVGIMIEEQQSPLDSICSDVETTVGYVEESKKNIEKMKANTAKNSRLFMKLLFILIVFSFIFYSFFL